MPLIPSSSHYQTTIAASRFLDAFDKATGRESSGTGRTLRMIHWRRKLAGSGVHVAPGARGPVFPLAYLLCEEDPRVCAGDLSPAQVRHQIRTCSRALWLCHVLSANTNARGFSPGLRASPYGPADIAPVADVVRDVLADDYAYGWLLDYTRELLAVFGKSHKCSRYVEWFAAKDTPTV